MLQVHNQILDVYQIINKNIHLTVRHLPTLQELKYLILTEINKQIDRKILEGFVWQEMPIWLSSENQFNYKAAFDLAIQTQGMNLPTTFKFGTTDEPIYYTFESVEDLQDFYTSAVKYINDTLAEGWKQKDSIDWEEYDKEIRRLNDERYFYFEELKKAEEAAKLEREKEFE